MCGLFGIIRPHGLTDEDEIKVQALSKQLRHRGPDGSGFIRRQQAVLGMHRLSIMDPENGWQPFWSEDGRWGALGNGEIYNAAHLRHRLTTKGHVFKTTSDIEVVPHMIEEYGLDSFIQFRGMFALLILDSHLNQVHLVRDQMGEKPLAWYTDCDSFVVSSEQSALVRAGVAPLKLDATKLPQYLLHGYVPEPHSLIKNIQKVPAGHVVTISLVDGTLSQQQYWNPLDAVGDRPLSLDDVAEAIEDAIISTCTSDVPVGIALSGGLDSSLVAVVAQRTRTDLQAFTVGYSETGPDESILAQELASTLGIPCHTTILHTQDVAREFGKVCADRDEPISDIAGPALAAIPRAARSAAVPVLLTGIGGDELFWGYDWIRQLAAWMTTYLQDVEQGANITRPRFLPWPPVLQAQIDWVGSLGGLLTDRRLRKFTLADERRGEVPLPFYEFQPGYRQVRRAMNALLPDRRIGAHAEYSGASDSDLMGALYTVMTNETYLRVNSLVQVDRLSMRHSIESRTPLTDPSLVATVLSGRLKSNDHLLAPKAVQREVARKFLPTDIVERPKRGFTPPVREWAQAIWHRNEGSLSGETSAELLGMPPKETREWMHSPTSKSGRVNQIGLRLLTLELWAQSL